MEFFASLLPSYLSGTKLYQRLARPGSWNPDWDHREDVVETSTLSSTGAAGVPRGAPSDVCRQIILIRHGQYDHNGDASGSSSACALTSLGEKQAEATGSFLRTSFSAASKSISLQARLRELRESIQHNRSARQALNDANPTKLEALKVEEESLKEERRTVRTEWLRCPFPMLYSTEPTSIFVSDMKRARQTADIILRAFPSSVRTKLQVDADLRERFPCDPIPTFSDHKATEDDKRIADEVFRRYFYRPPPAQTTSTVDIIVGHANVIRFLSLRALQLPPEAWLRMSIAHCSMTSFVIDSRGHVKLHSLGSYGHLPPHLCSYRNTS